MQQRWVDAGHRPQRVPTLSDAAALGPRQALCSPATACADAKRCRMQQRWVDAGHRVAHRVPTPGIVFAGHSVVGTTTHRRKEVCGGQATVVGHSVCGRRTARYRTARRRVTLYGAPLARRPTAARRCAAGTELWGVEVDDEPHDSPARREAGTDAGRGAEWWNGGDTTGRGKVMNASVSAVKALNHGASRCAVPCDAVWGVVGTTTHRRKEVCGGQATVVGHSVC